MQCLWPLVLLLACQSAGCAAAEQHGQVAALGNQQAAALDADDVVRIMRRAGFNDQQILELGTDLRNALASTGAAQIRVGRSVEAIFAADEQTVCGSSRQRGPFVYDLKTGCFR
jgi:hypothetical protein